MDRLTGLLLTAAVCLAAFLVSGPALATTSVYIKNNTRHSIKLVTRSTLPNGHWKTVSNYVPAWGRARIYETNRDEGVKKGKTYQFTTEVIPRDPKTGNEINQSPHNFALLLKLKGTTTHSHMWQSVRRQSGGNGGWHDDRQKYSDSMTINGKRWNVTYWAYGTGGDDSVEYVIREEYPLPAGFRGGVPSAWKAAHLNVLTYNMFMRPFELFPDGQLERLPMVPQQLKGYDVVVFQELADDDIRRQVVREMKKYGYKYASSVVGRESYGAGGKLHEDGGIIIVSRWPIVSEDQEPFGGVCSGDDCFGDKGVLHVKINKRISGKNNFFHVFGTHMNNGNWGVQSKQLQIIKRFIDSKNIPKSQGVLIAGDLNVNRTSGRFKTMLSLLNAGYFSGGQLRGHKYTADRGVNDMNSEDRSYLDYVLFSKGHRQPTSASYAEVRIPRAYHEWKALPTDKAKWDLSDHFPVYASYHFVDDPLADWDPGIKLDPSTEYLCNKDSDCKKGLFCALGVSPIPGAKRIPPPGPPKATKAKTGGTLVKPGKTAKKAGPKTIGKPGKTAGKSSSGVALYGGVCRIPPPK